MSATQAPLVAGNIKMYLDRTTLAALLRSIRAEVGILPHAAPVVMCPAFPHLPLAQEILGTGPVALGAQNMHWDAEGPRTGEVAPGMLREAGCRYVILGHSERRTLFGETDDQVGKKVRAALENGLLPILCVGETESERRAGATEVVLTRQLLGALSGLPALEPGGIVVAYEPVWAIGTGKTATPEMASEAHGYIRGELDRRLGPHIARGVRILYGGSVKPDNAAALFAAPQVDGALVGGACLAAETFLPIVRAASELTAPRGR